MFHSFSAPHDTIKKQDLQEKENFAILILYVARAGGGKMKLYFKVPPEADGMLLRGFLRRCSVSTDLSRAVKFRGSGFFADGAPILANRRVEAGQVISFELPPEGEGVAPQDDIPVDVVYEDAFALVVEKPPHLAVHPTLNYPLDTLANGYAAWALRQGRSPVFRPVNRIDKDTSGLVLAAQNGYAAPLLAQRVEKLYYAVAEGELPLGPGVIDAPIGRQGESIIGRCVTPDGKPSRTEYTILKAENGLSLAACVPVTGRTHQIRVHFASIGHPLAGDDLYGGSRARIGRQALHCAKQTFWVPRCERMPDGIRIEVPVDETTLRPVTVESPLPEEERTPLTPAVPFMADSMGMVMYCSTSSAVRPGASVWMVTRGTFSSGNTSTGMFFTTKMLTIASAIVSRITVILLFRQNEMRKFMDSDC